MLATTSTTPTLPYMVVCTVDGTIVVLDAQDGSISCMFKSGVALVGPSSSLPSGRRIVPGLDGRLYVTSPLYSNEEQEENHDEFLTPLDITVLDVLQNPVKTCNDHETDCGIVTGTKSTSLFAIDTSTGLLIWQQSPHGTTTRHYEHDDDISNRNTVLLQREDILVQQISTDSGNSVWNVTLGTFQALEFEADGQTSPDPEDSLPGDKTGPSNIMLHSQSNVDEESTKIFMPCVMFGPDGTSLSAVDPTTSTILWKQDFATVVASVFGLNGNAWKQLIVLEEGDPKESQRLPKTDVGLTIHRPPPFQKFLSSNRYLKELDWMYKQSKQDDAFFYYSNPACRKTSLLGVDDFNSVDPVCLLGKHSTTTKGPLALPSPNNHDKDDDIALEIIPQATDIRSDGLFLTWPVIAAILSLSVVLIQKFYEYKKRKWYRDFEEKAEMTLTATSTDITQGLIEPPEGSNRPLRFYMHNQKTINLKKSISVSDVDQEPQPPQVQNTSIVVFQNADPINGGFFGKSDQKESTISSPNNGNKESFPPSSANASPTLQTQPHQEQQGVGFLMDGIPLVRYSRYESEFREIMALGKGGFGTVFQCQNVLDGREYAIKKICLKSDSSLPPQQFQQQLQRTLREVKSLALLDHPHVVRYYTAWLELDNNNDDFVNNAVATVGASDYYLFSPPDDYNSQFTITMDKAKASKSERYSKWRRHSLEHLQTMTDFNPLGGWSGNALENTEEEIVFSNMKGVPLELDEYGFTFERSEKVAHLSSSKIEEEGKAVNVRTNSKSNNDLALVKYDERGDTSRKGFFSDDSSASEANSARKSQSEWSIEESFRPSGLTLLKNDSNGSAMQKDNDNTENDSQAVLVKHILYIQMQFCSQKTLAAFLSNQEARKGPSGGDSVNIPYALNLFLQIVQGVCHVHLQGLIHRDLKPNNCFIDDAGVVKVGDFGLSRESGESKDEDATLASKKEMDIDVSPGDITAGVGTRSYASPEQMQGGDYDSSTDIYSLGIMLFELCYPMYTAMERYIVMNKLRNHIFPDHWLAKVKPAFPSLHTLLLSMLSNSPSERPTAHVVAQSIEAILEKMTISSLDQKHQREGSILLRVEAKPRDDVLRHTIELLKEAAAPTHIDILQYGLRGGTTEAIMEFALGLDKKEDEVVSDVSSDTLVSKLVHRMSECSEIILIRQIFGENWR